MANTENEIIALLYKAVSDHSAWCHLLTALSGVDPRELPALEESLSTHLTQADNLSSHVDSLSHQSNLIQKMVDVLPMPIILVGRNGKHLGANENGRRYRERCLPGWWGDNSGHPGNLKQTDILTHLDTADESSPSVVKAIPRSNQHPSSYVWVIPISDHDTNDQESVFALIPSELSTNPDSFNTESNQSALSIAFNLTPAETRLVLGLLTGDSLSQIAKSIGISYQTGRSQLKSIFQKTGCKRQPDLIIRTLQIIWHNGEPAKYADQTPPLSRPNMIPISLRNGRSMELTSRGKSTDYPVFYFKSVTGTVLSYLSDDELFTAGIRLLIVDRPGLGTTSPLANRSLINSVQDIKEIADQLELKRFSVMGFGVGSLYALTAGFSLSDRIDSITTISASAPYAVGKKLGYGSFFRVLTRVANRSPRMFKHLISVILRAVLEKPGNYTRAVKESGLNMEDLQLLDDPLVKQLSKEDLSNIVRQGAKYLAEDLQLTVRPWGFELSDIHVPVNLWHGSNDEVIFPPHGEYLHKHLPNSQLNMVEGGGHLTLMHNWQEILESIQIKHSAHSQPTAVKSATTSL